VVNVKQAMIAANQFIVEHLPDRFSAGLPKLVLFPLRPLWIVPVHLTYPGKGVIGKVGMLAVDGDHPVIVGWTPPEEMETMAHQFYQENRDEIESVFSAAYLTMSEQERQTEVALAEEGLWAQPELAIAFPEEDEWPWWE
jgi:hypothetical protein